MTNDLILLTGASGFLGQQVLVQALQAGHRVRCAVRSAKSIERILDSNDIANLGKLTQRISWVIVPDITSPGAYNEAVVDAQYIIHVASPVGDLRTWGKPKTNDEESFIKPAVAGVTGILASATSHSPSLKRIVVTSSIVAIFSPRYLQGLESSEGVIHTAETRIQDIAPPYPPGSAYLASKVAALNASEAWMKEHNPHFDMISILPAWIWGRQDLATCADDLLAGSNGILLGVLDGKPKEHPINSSVVSVTDCARAHLLALNPQIEGQQAFIVGKLENLADANAIARKHVPDAVSQGLFSDTSNQPTLRIPQDETKTKTVLGLRQQSFEEVVKEVATQYWELSKKE